MNVNLIDFKQYLSNLKNERADDGIWFDRYIAFLNAVIDNQLFSDDICTMENFKDRTELNNLVDFTYNKLLEVNFQPQNHPIESLNGYLVALPGFSWTDSKYAHLNEHQFDSVAHDQHKNVVDFIVDFMKNYVNEHE